MKTAHIRRLAFFGDEDYDLLLPKDWEVSVCSEGVKNAPTASDEEIKEAFLNPIGTKTIGELAKTRKEAAILVDDLTRPTPAYRVLPFVLEELTKGGIYDEHIRIIVALGTHGPLTRSEITKKIGVEMMERIDVWQNHPFDCLTLVGETSHGAPVYINQEFMECDLKISLGGVTPEDYDVPYYSGGAKMVLPGVAGVETIYHDHGDYKYHPFKSWKGKVSNRQEIARIVGLDICADSVINSKRDIARIFVGDFVEEHRRAVKYAEKTYDTNIPKNMDVVITNAYPFDANLSGTGAPKAIIESIRHEGILVNILAGPRGIGLHYFMGRWGKHAWSKGYRTHPQLRGKKRQLPKNVKTHIVFSPICSLRETRSICGEDAIVVKTWTEVLEEIFNACGRKLNVAIYPSKLSKPKYI